ncbi:MAG: fibronectin type III domain-containing protein [bacterium]
MPPHAARYALAAFLIALGAQAQAQAVGNLTNLNPGNQYVTVTPGAGEIRLHWEDTKGPIRAWWVYHEEGRIAANAASRMCARRWNARRFDERTKRNAHIRGLKELTHYTFMVEAEYRDQPSPRKNPKCDYVLHLDARTDATPRALRKVSDLFAYGIRGGVAFHHRARLKGYLEVYHKLGKHDAAHMCKFRPNQRAASRTVYAGTNLHIIRRLESRELYTVMLVEKRDDNACHYSMGHATPDPHGSAKQSVQNLAPGFEHASHLRGDGAILIRWKQPHGNVSRYYIYYMPGTIADDAITPARLCRDRPDRIRIERDGREHLVTGLDNGRAYTFMVAAVPKSRQATNADCDYLYHFTATPKKVRIHSFTHKNPDHTFSRATPGDGKVLLKWRYGREEHEHVYQWHIYQVEGIAKDVRKLCTERPNPTVIQASTINTYYMLDLKNDTPYTFMVEPHYKNYLPPQVRSHCDYVYHVHATPVPD